VALPDRDPHAGEILFVKMLVRVDERQRLDLVL